MKNSINFDYKVNTASTRSTMNYKTKLNLGRDHVIKRLSFEEVDMSEKLSLGINYLHSLKSTNRSAAEFIEDSAKILSILDKIYVGADKYKPWVRYFDVVNKARSDYGSEEAFNKGISKLVKDFLLKKVDWRIAKKILEVKEVFNPNIA